MNPACHVMKQLKYNSVYARALALADRLTGLFYFIFMFELSVDAPLHVLGGCGWGGGA